MSSQYGWTDDQILDLTAGRLRQITNAIGARLEADLEQRAALIETQTKYLVGAAHGAVGSKAMDRAVRAVQFLKKRRKERGMVPFEDVGRRMGVSQGELDAAAARGRRLGARTPRVAGHR